MALVRTLPLVAAVALCGAGPGPVQAQQKGAAQPAPQQQPQQGTQPEEEEPSPAPLTVGSMAIASDAMLSVTSMAVDVSVERVSYVYRLRNRGTARLALAASVSLPDLEVNNEGTTFFVLPAPAAENFVGLEVRTNNQPTPTNPRVQAVALGIDRAAELKAENIPLIPFGEASEKAFAAAKPETIQKLIRLGLTTPRDPAQPTVPVIADWSLRVVHGWTQTLEPNVDTNVTVSFMPVRAVYTIDASAVAGFDSLKEQVCLTPQILAAVKTLLKAKGATADVADITLSNDGPARWLDNPPPTISVRKPTPDTVVAFCGLDPATQNQLVVRGKLAGSNEASGSRVLIFTRNAAQ